MGGTPVPAEHEETSGEVDEFPTGDAIRAAREAAGWSIVEAARKLKQRSPRPLPALDSLVRSWKRWEKGTVPSLPYRPDLADLLKLSFGQIDSAQPVAEILQVYANQAAAAAEIRALASQAAAIDVLAVRGLGVLALNDSLLRPSMTQRTRPLQLRVLLVRPHSDAAQRRAEEINEPPASFSAGIILAQARLREIATLPHVTVEGYEYDVLPVWRLVNIDGTLFVSTFTPEWEGHESRLYKLVATQIGPLYQGFQRTFDDLLERSTRII
jgi:hypothetical protein